MKALLFIFCVFCPLLVIGQTSPADTTRINTALRATASLSQSVTTLSQSVSALATRTDTLTKRVDKALKSVSCTFCQPELGNGERLLVIMPLLLFIIASFYILTRLRLEGYKLSDALKENYVVDVSKTTEGVAAQMELQKEMEAQGLAGAAPAGTANTPTEVRPQSTSRLIVFFTGMSAIIISVSAVSFFFYVYLRTGQEPEFESLWNVVLGLGVGVVPYAFNRVSDALNPKPTK